MANYMRLKTVRIVKQEDGKDIKVKKWYSNFASKTRKGFNVEVTLDAFEYEERKATVNLGKRMQEDLDGVMVTGSRKRIASMSYPKDDYRGQRDWALHIEPFFGRYKIAEITGDLIEDFIHKQWGEEAPQSTVKKQLLALKRVIQGVRPKWELPEFEYIQRDLPFKSRINRGHVEAAMQFLEGENLGAYMVMEQTGMEPMDAVTLASVHLMGSVILKIRSKSRKSKRKPRIKVALTPVVKEGLRMAPKPATPETPYFQAITNKGLSTAVGRAFDRVFYPCMSRKTLLDARKENEQDYPYYGPKDLRRYRATRLFNRGKGIGWDQVAQILGQVKGSNMTSLYTEMEDEIVVKAFKEAL